MEKALGLVSQLSRPQQDAIAAQIVDLVEHQPDPASMRFQWLIEQKYIRGLNAAEVAEIEQLESEFQKQDEVFYRPILDRLVDANHS